MNKKILFNKSFKIIIFILTFLFGFLLGYLFGVKGKKKAVNQELLQAKEDIEQKYQRETVQNSNQLSEKIFFTTGRISKIKENALEIELPLFSGPEPSPLKVPISQKSEKILVKIAQTTEIIKQEMKTPEELLEDAKSPITNRLSHKEIRISLNELKIGDIVEVQSAEKIEGKKELTAKKIILLPKLPKSQ
jgi:hypothetical protein